MLMPSPSPSVCRVGPGIAYIGVSEIRETPPNLMEGSGASRTIYCYDVQLSHTNGTQLLGQRIPVAFHSTYRHS